MTGRKVRPDLLIVACAISAGVHAALVPGHLRESTTAGAGFFLSSLLLGLLAVGLTLRPGASGLLRLTPVVLGGLIVSYVLATTTGVPLVHPEVEPVAGLAVVTKAVEAVGLLAALSLNGVENAVSPNVKGATT